jgi:hypothetical protein
MTIGNCTPNMWSLWQVVVSLRLTEYWNYNKIKVRVFPEL